MELLQPHHAEAAELRGFARPEEELPDIPLRLEIVPISELLPNSCRLLQHPNARTGIIFQEPDCTGIQQCNFVALEGRAIHPGDIYRGIDEDFPHKFMLRRGLSGQLMHLWYAYERRYNDPELTLYIEAYYETYAHPPVQPVRKTVRQIAQMLAYQKRTTGILSEICARGALHQKTALEDL